MAKTQWQDAKKITEGFELCIGPYFAHQFVKMPKHVLFTLARYKFAAKMISPGATILELGCNEGIGTLLLAETAERVVAVDFDTAANAYAKEHLEFSKIEFVADDFIGKRYGTFDFVVSLDVIEHIDPRREDDYMTTVLDNLSLRQGTFIVGTPNDCASKYASEGSKLGHVNMYTAERLDGMLRKYFRNVFSFGMNDEVLHTGFSPMCHYLLAIACNVHENDE